MVVLDWLIAPGSSFDEGDVLLEVETDKATMEIDAPFDGVLAKQLCEPGQSVAPGELIAWLADPGEEFDPDTLDGAGTTGASADGGAVDTVPEVSAGAVATAPTPVPAPSRVGARRREPARLVDHGELRGIPAMDPDASRPPAAAPTLDPGAVGDFDAVPFSRHRGAIARSMTASAAIPQFAVDRDLEMDVALEALRRLRAAESKATLSDLLLLASAAALSEVPAVNGWCDGTQVWRFEAVNIALAVDGAEGVIAPVLHAVGALSPHELVVARARAVELARAGRVTSADLADATFTISNIGPLGAHGLVPMLTPPQVGILALGAARRDGETRVIKATFVGDHRAIDGADGARFLSALASTLERLPGSLGA
jgi:pyruvate dehydrogenase E2 component (dihydrolipoamide acetyltransferase)